MNQAVPSPRFRSALSPIALAGLALLAAGACSGQPADAPVRTVTPSGSWTAPSARQAADRDRALLRVVSAIPGMSRLDVFVEGQKIVDGVEYKTITPYMEVASGRQALRLRPAGMDTAEPLAEESQQLRAGRHYTAVIMPGEEDGPAAAIKIFDDPMDAPDENRAKLRVVHAAADAGRIDVHMQGRGDALARALEFQHASDLIELQPSPAAIELRPAQRTETMLRLPDLRLSSGGMYTVVVIGRTRIEPPLETLVLEDRIAGP
jgi:hypothetical protein